MGSADDARTTIMQKVVTPQASTAYSDHGFDRIAGFVLRAADAAVATTPAELFELLGLGFPGTPHRADATHVDVLRFPAAPQLRFERATGGTSHAALQMLGGTFVEPPPFTGTGFATLRDTLAPLFWMAHSRVPAGSELWRIGADGSEARIAVHEDVGHGWTTATGDPVQRAHRPEASRHVGPVARWDGISYTADPLPGGAVVLAAPHEPETGGFERTPVGRWRRVVTRDRVDALFEMNTTARWNGLPVQVVDADPHPSKAPMSRIAYTGHDAGLAAKRGMETVDAAVYEATVRSSSLTRVENRHFTPAAWTRRNTTPPARIHHDHPEP